MTLPCGLRRDSPSERPDASGEAVASARAGRSTLFASVPRRGTNRSVKLSPTRADVERELERRMLLNEQRRSAGFLAVFGAPLSKGSDDCVNAMAAARQIMRELDSLVSASDVPPTQIGIALHAGLAIVGNVGSADRKEYTVIGDVVNVAFRIEALNKEFGSTLLISKPVRSHAGIEAEPMPPMMLRGRREPMELFRVA